MAAIRRGEDRRKLGIRIVTVVIALLALLPLVYVFNGFRLSTEEARQFNAVQRAGAGYIGPLTTLLAALVDAQGAAVRGQPVAPGPVREAMEQVDRVDAVSGEALGARQRWTQLQAEIEAALGKPGSGPEAMRNYAEPIALTQALFTRIGDASMIARDPKVDAQYLIDTAVVGVPEVIVNAGQVAGLAGTVPSSDPRIAVALDRITRAAQAIRVGPNSDTDQVAAGPASMSLLQPLDEFTAAADGMVHAASVPNLQTPQALAELDSALTRVRQAALGLDLSVLEALNALLDRRLVEIDAQRRNMVIAAVLTPLAAALALLVLWLGTERLGRRPAGLAGPSSEAPSAAGPDRTSPDPSGLERIGARGLGREQIETSRGGPARLGRELVGAGHGTKALQPREAR